MEVQIKNAGEYDGIRFNRAANGSRWTVDLILYPVVVIKSIILEVTLLKSLSMHKNTILQLHRMDSYVCGIGGMRKTERGYCIFKTRGSKFSSDNGNLKQEVKYN